MSQPPPPASSTGLASEAARALRASIVALQAPEPAPPVPSSQRPLRREGAIMFRSAAEQAMEAAMMRTSPEPEIVLGKRPRSGNVSDSDTEPDDGATTTPSISNVAVVIQKYMVKKRLRPEQRDEMDAFLFDTALGRQAKLLTCIMALDNKIDIFRSATPPYQLSDELKTNITNYGIAVLLSVNVNAYKGNIPRNHVLVIIKKYRFDLPTGIEHDYANWEKVSGFVGYSLTQTRARMKKLIKDSIVNDTNIFALAQVIVHNTPCRVTIQLCGRVALMRAIHAESNGGEKYWDLVDARLEFIRKIAGTASDKTAATSKAFNEILRIDRCTYGAHDEYAIPEKVLDEWQQGVDEVIALSDEGNTTVLSP